MYFLIFALSFINIVAKDPLEFVVLIASYNNENYYLENLNSVISQKTKIPYKVVYIDDCSTDNTGQLVDSFIKDNRLKDVITVIHNKERIGKLANFYYAINSLPSHVVIIELDGDDFLAHHRVFDRVAREYLEKDTWLTYGQFQFYNTKVKGFCREIPQDVTVTNSIRKYPDWITAHLRTFKAGLFQKIKKEDLLYKDSFYLMAADIAYMYPMLEMASRGHISFIPDILYTYRYQNPISDHNISRRYQAGLNDYICQQKIYEPLEYL